MSDTSEDWQPGDVARIPEPPRPVRPPEGIDGHTGEVPGTRDTNARILAEEGGPEEFSPRPGTYYGHYGI